MTHQNGQKLNTTDVHRAIGGEEDALQIGGYPTRLPRRGCWNMRRTWQLRHNGGRPQDISGGHQQQDIYPHCEYFLKKKERRSGGGGWYRV